MNLPRALLLIAIPLVGLSDRARSDDPAPPLDSKATFEALKGLVGEWRGELNGQEYSITYRLTGAGSTLVETFFPGTDHEMISMYHLDGSDLRMTHYCAAGNQPRLKLDRAASTGKKLVFAFDGGSNLDPIKDMHIHEGKIELGDENHLAATWVAYQGGKPLHSEAFELTRKK